MTRRMMLVVLALMGLMVLVVSVSPPQPGVEDRSAPAPSPRQPQLSNPDEFDVSATLSAAAGANAREQTVEAELGDRVEIVVEAREIDSVALGDLGQKTVEAGLPARFELLAETRGTYPLVLVNADRRIGTLEIR